MPTIVELLMDTAKTDTDLLVKNDARGDKLAIAREVDFLLRAPTAEKAKLAADFINENCYGKAETSSDDTGHKVAVFIEMPITQHILCSVSGFMACISTVFNLDYDGWGSVIQTGS